jgi:hypothetical protein
MKVTKISPESHTGWNYLDDNEHLALVWNRQIFLSSNEKSAAVIENNFLKDRNKVFVQMFPENNFFLTAKF